MDVEDLVREAVRRSDPPPEPSPQFTARVMAALPERRRGSPSRRASLRPTAWRALGRAVAFAAVVAVAGGALLLPAVLPRPIGGVASGTSPSAAASSSAAPTTATPVPTAVAVAPSPSPTPTDAPGAGLTFAPGIMAEKAVTLAVPSGWHSTSYDLPFTWSPRVQTKGGKLNPSLPATLSSNLVAPLASLGTGDLTVSCRNPKPGEYDASKKAGAICTYGWSLPAGGIELRISYDGRDALLDGCCTGIYNVMNAAVDAPARPAGTEVVTIGGLPAWVATSHSSTVPGGNETIAGADEVRVYKLLIPADWFHGYVVTAALRGPDLPALEAQLDTVMAGLRYVQPAAQLHDDAASRAEALRGTLDRMAQIYARTKSDPRDWFNPACFSAVPDVATKATITENVFASNRGLSKPLAVRCIAHIAATPAGVWTVTFEYQWDAVAGHKAGSASQVYVSMPDEGEPIPVGGLATNEDAMPYIQPRHNWGAG